MRLALPATGLLAALAVLAAPAEAAPEADGFGPSEIVAGVFFSNFENARFHVCGVAGGVTCDRWTEGEGYSLSCSAGACDALDRTIKANAKPPMETVVLDVVLVGRRSVSRAPARFIGDPGRTLHVERVEHVSLRPE